VSFGSSLARAIQQPLVSALDILEAHARGRMLALGELHRFEITGVTAKSLAIPHPVRRDLVMFGQDGSFEFSRDTNEDTGAPAFTLIVSASAGPIDIVAWQPKPNRIALWLNRGFALGEEQIWRARLDRPMPIWRTPMSWLRSGRDGLVLLRPDAAFHYLSELSTVAAEDFEHAQEIQRLLRPPMPRTKILIPTGPNPASRSEGL
jgi:hypothetical protein